MTVRDLGRCVTPLVVALCIAVLSSALLLAVHQTSRAAAQETVRPDQRQFGSVQGTLASGDASDLSASPVAESGAVPSDLGSIGTSANLTAYLPLVLTGPTWDPCEPNDNLAQACGPLISGEPFEAFIHEGDPNDFYFIDITTLMPVVVRLTVPLSLDLDLFLLDATHAMVALSNTSGYGVPETLSYSPVETGTLYIWVYPFAGWSASDPYAVEAIYD